MRNDISDADALMGESPRSAADLFLTLILAASSRETSLILGAGAKAVCFQIFRAETVRLETPLGDQTKT